MAETPLDPDNNVVNCEAEEKVAAVLAETATARTEADIFLSTRFERHMERIADALEKIAGAKQSPAWEGLMRERQGE